MKKKIAIILVISIVFSSVGLTYGANASDLQNHWGREVIQEWMDEGFISGYPDGSFRPDKAITRAEFMVLVNKAFDFETEGSINFIDVANTDWYFDAIRVASASSYIEGYPDGSMKPNNPISRQEVTAILSKITNAKIDAGVITAFADANEIAPWAKDSVEAAASKGYMQGYPDGTFKPKNNITRAEAVVTLNKALTVKVDKEIVVYNKAGIYGPQTGITTITKDVMVASKGVTLQNMTIKGNLTIDEEVGTGDVYLNNVTVEGKTFIQGGGKDSIHIDGGSYNKIIVQKTSSGNVRIVATNIDGLEIIISEAAEGQAVILEGSFDSVTIDASYIDLVIQGETVINEFVINKGVKDLSVSLSNKTSIAKLLVNAKIEVTGRGTIKVASGKEVNNSTFEKAPDRIINSSSGGSSGGGNPSRVAVSAITIIGNNTVVNGGTLQLGVTVTPVNATDKTVIWSVAPGTGLATISKDGLLTATALGTVTVSATNVDSGISGTKLITVTTVPNESQLAPTGLTGVAPITLGGNDGKITGTTTAMEYKLATDTVWTPVIGTEITGLRTGIYNVRYAAKEGYNAGASAYVVIFADNYESEEGNNSYQTAKLIATDGTLQSHAIYPAGDEDWVKFSAVEGNIYQIATSNLIDDMNNYEDMDTYIELYNMDGRTLIFDNDDYNYYGGLESKIFWHCSTTGTYYVRIMHYTHIDYDSNNPDTGTGSYDISITKSAATELHGIDINDWACKHKYYVGDLLDITGLVVIGHYSNDIVAVETITAENVTGFDSSVPTVSQILTVTINGKTATYSINIAPAHTLEEVKSEVEGALDRFIVENTTTEADILAVVREVIKNINITAEFTVAFAKAEAIVGTAGSVTGIITLTNNADSQTKTIIVNKEIAALVLVTEITVTDEYGTATVECGNRSQMYAEVTPLNATNQTILWTVEAGTGTATISANGLLRATSVGTVTVTATNVASGVTGSITIGITEKALTIIGYRGFATELDIPQVIVGSEIDEDNYYGDFKIEGTIRSGETGVVTIIDNYAFTGCMLTRVTIPNSVVIIGEGSFENNQLNSVTIPSNVEYIGDYAFYGNILTSITIGPDVSIGDYLLVGNNDFRNTYLGIGGGAGIYIGSQDGAWTRGYVAISGISVFSAGDVTSVANSKTLQMNAVLTPPNATNVPLTWSVVTLEDGTATINEDGLLTATGVGTVTVTALDTITGSYGTKNITITMGEQLAPTGLVGVAPTIFGGSDGKITGTTTEMEYKLEADEDITYATCSANETTDLEAGNYVVRLEAKTGYNAGATTAVTVPAYEEVPNGDQAAPTGLTGVAPTAALDDGKITGTTTAMEYKLSTEPTTWTPATVTEITGLAAGTYNVRLAAKAGLNAGAMAVVTVPAYVAPDTTPADSTSGITNQKQGALGSKQVALTIAVKNAAGDNLTNFVATDFTVKVKSAGMVVSSGSFNELPFSSFENNGGGTYTIVYTGSGHYSYYEFTDLAVKSVVIEAGPTGVSTPAAVAPILESATVSADGMKITLAFDKAMHNPACSCTPSLFIAVVDGKNRTFSATALNADNTKIDLTLNDIPIVQGATVTLSYSGAMVQSTDLGFMGYLNNQSVINNSTVELITDVTSAPFTLVTANDSVTITLIGGTFKEGVIVDTDFTFAGTDATALAAGTFTRTSDTVVTITGLTGLAGTDNTVLVKAASQSTQASSVEAAANEK